MKAKGTIVAVFAAILMMAAPAGAAVGVAGHWSFDENAGTTAVDDSGFANTGTLEGATTWIAGRRGGALSLDGLTGRVRVPTAASLEPATVTVSAWVKDLGSPGPFRYIVAKGATGCAAASYALYSGPDGGLRFYVSGDGGTSYTRSPDAGTGVWDGTWHHIAGTFDGGTVRLYVDGTEVGAGAPRTAPIDYAVVNSRDLFVGHYGSCADQPLDFPGAVDDPKVFSRSLSASEIATEASPYTFRGFLAPVNNEPTLNVSKAGSAIPVKFSLGGSFGLGILAAGSPSSQAMSCSSTAPLDLVELTVTAGASSLQYDAVKDVYSYVWKTDKTWANSCRRLFVRLDDGSVHMASFEFSR